jgi:hypothetical protein
MKVLIACLFCIAALQGCAAADVGKPSGSAMQASGSIDTWYDGGINEHDHYHGHGSGSGHGGRGR